ncbi:MAG: mechanosensitive ion channel protein MscS [Flavobacteriales bacterium]|nr:MAG: mechanosensitive ion channel protein MscS [Flavobacteriales bacterium]
METAKEFLEFKLVELDAFSLSVYTLVYLLLIFLIAWGIVKFVKIIFKRLDTSKKINEGKRFAITKIIQYFVYTLALILAIDSIGIDITILLASSAALFVGIGFGLQDIFRDFLSGIMLLFEPTIEVGDVVEVDTLVGRVEEINLRTSTVKTRDNVRIIVPNSILIGNNLINWSHGQRTTRFAISVGVAYGSDTEKVMSALLECAAGHPEILKTHKPFVRFTDFGDSALAFELYFWTENTWQVEQIKSDLRFAIDKSFRENDITIPFPQRDLHVKTVPSGWKA